MQRICCGLSPVSVDVLELQVTIARCANRTWPIVSTGRVVSNPRSRLNGPSACSRPVRVGVGAANSHVENSWARLKETTSFSGTWGRSKASQKGSGHQQTDCESLIHFFSHVLEFARQRRLWAFGKISLLITQRRKIRRVTKKSGFCCDPCFPLDCIDRKSSAHFGLDRCLPNERSKRSTSESTGLLKFFR